jgi:hypothetical protein
MGVKRNNAVGVKGRSGRKSAPVEFAKAQAIIKAWNKVMESIDTYDADKIALPIALKDMVQKVEGGVSVLVSLAQKEKVDKLIDNYLNGLENNK